jgi:hypothetical protein
MLKRFSIASTKLSRSYRSNIRLFQAFGLPTLFVKRGGGPSLLSSPIHEVFESALTRFPADITDAVRISYLTVGRLLAGFSRS